ncbi:MAG: polyisoprenoid-binding protein [Rhizobiales bacterium]|nr:polyisoprenoid-binding protein [Hyphomicrobiales bacterium]
MMPVSHLFKPLTMAALFFALALPMAAHAVPLWQVTQKDGVITWEGTTGDGTVFQGHCNKFDSEIAFDPAALDQSSVKVTINMASCLTGDEQKDQLLPLDAWFDVPGFPQGVFEATSFEDKGDGQYVANGMLSLKGVSQPLALPFRLDIQNDTAHVTGETTIDRTNFNIGVGQWGGPEIAGVAVKIRIDLNATTSGS